MTTECLINALAEIIQEATSDLIMKSAQSEGIPVSRAPEILKYALDKPDQWKKCVPYVLIMPTGGSTTQFTGGERHATEGILLVCAAYDRESEAKGLKAVSVLMDRIKIAILKRPVIGKYFTINLEAAPFEWKPYLEGSEPYFIADANLLFNVPPVQTEVAEFI